MVVVKRTYYIASRYLGLGHGGADDASGRLRGAGEGGGAVHAHEGLHIAVASTDPEGVTATHLDGRGKGKGEREAGCEGDWNGKLYGK